MTTPGGMTSLISRGSAGRARAETFFRNARFAWLSEGKRTRPARGIAFRLGFFQANHSAGRRSGASASARGLPRSPFEPFCAVFSMISHLRHALGRAGSPLLQSSVTRGCAGDEASSHKQANRRLGNVVARSSPIFLILAPHQQFCFV